MAHHNIAYGINGELAIQRHNQGIQLVKPVNVDTPQNLISNVYGLPFSIYFLDSTSCIIDANNIAAQYAGRQTINDIVNHSVNDLWEKSFSDKIIAYNRNIILSQKNAFYEENGSRKDGTPIRVMTFKFPWYHEDKIIGLFGLSIIMDSIDDFACKMSSLFATGLIGTSSLPKIIPDIQYNDVHLSKREIEVLSYLVRGKTAKSIGECLSISKRTVEIHIVNIKCKTNISSKSELIDAFFEKFHQ